MTLYPETKQNTITHTSDIPLTYCTVSNETNELKNVDLNNSSKWTTGPATHELLVNESWHFTDTTYHASSSGQVTSYSFKTIIAFVHNPVNLVNQKPLFR
jgi:hypothetical protein